MVTLASLPPAALPISKLVNGARYRLEYGLPPQPVLAALEGADLTAETASGKQQHLRTALLSFQQDNCSVIVDGAASGSQNLNIIRLAERLADLTGSHTTAITRQCLLDHSGRPI